MNFKQVPTRLLPVLFLLCSAGLQLSATPIYSGTITSQRPFMSGFFSFAGSGFSANGSFIDGYYGAGRICEICSPGTTVNVDAGGITDFCCGEGSATLGGDPFRVDWSTMLSAGNSYFTMTGGLVTITGPGLFTAPFSFRGALCGSVSSAVFPYPCVVDLPYLTGSGLAKLEVVRWPDGLMGLTRITYTFTPEPNLAVTVLAALMLGALLRRRVCA